MSNTPNCMTLTNGLTSLACAGVKRHGGVDGDVFIGFKSDITTLTIASTGEITAFAMTAASLYKLAGRQYEHDFGYEVVEMSPRNMFKQYGELKGYPYVAATHDAIEKFQLGEKLFAVVFTMDGQVKAYGIDVNPKVGTVDADRGLKAVGGGGKEGILFENSEAETIRLEFLGFNKPKLFIPASSASANRTLLAALLAA